MQIYAAITGNVGTMNLANGTWENIERKKMIDETYNELNKKTEFTFKLLSVIKKCREKGKHDLCVKLIKKYNIDKEKLEEAYYD